MSFLDSKYGDVEVTSNTKKRYYNSMLLKPIKYRSTQKIDSKLDGNGWFYMKTAGDEKDLFLIENRDLIFEGAKKVERGEVYQVGRFVN